MEAVKEEEKMIKENRQQFLTEFKRMKQCEAMGNEEMEQLFGAKACVENLINQGYLDNSGRPIVRK